MSVEVMEMKSLVAPRWAADCWDEKDEVELICRSVRDVTHDVKTFLFQAPDQSVFRFLPGQFITLRLLIADQEVSRCYTISSPPTRPHLIAITVKRVPGGPVSNWLHDHLVPGEGVRVAAPLGVFTLPSADDSQRYVFLSGGSGITPLMSMLRTLHDLGSEADVVFVHSARTPDDIVFRRELEGIAAVMPNVRVVNVCENDSTAERWQGLRGRLTREALLAVAPDLHDRVALCCGPAPYMASVRTLLETSGHDMSRYHEESFSFGDLPLEAPPAPAGDEVDSPARAGDQRTVFAVEFTKSGRTIVCRPDEYVLDAALKAGLRLPSTCGQGMCGTCKTTMLSGEVDMQHNGGIRPKEVALNKVLICCSKPLSDLRLES